MYVQTLQRHRLKLIIALFVILIVGLAYAYYIFTHAPPESVAEVDFELPEEEEETLDTLDVKTSVKPRESTREIDPMLQRIDMTRHRGA
jgi:uncharacterized protein involved in exopolysaccharide biosynthesis